MTKRHWLAGVFARCIILSGASAAQANSGMDARALPLEASAACLATYDVIKAKGWHRDSSTDEIWIGPDDHAAVSNAYRDAIRAKGGDPVVAAKPRADRMMTLSASNPGVAAAVAECAVQVFPEYRAASSDPAVIQAAQCYALTSALRPGEVDVETLFFVLESRLLTPVATGAGMTGGGAEMVRKLAQLQGRRLTASPTEAMRSEAQVCPARTGLALRQKLFAHRDKGSEAEIFVNPFEWGGGADFLANGKAGHQLPGIMSGYWAGGGWYLKRAQWTKAMGDAGLHDLMICTMRFPHRSKTAPANGATFIDLLSAELKARHGIEAVGSMMITARLGSLYKPRDFISADLYRPCVKLGTTLAGKARMTFYAARTNGALLKLP